MAFKYGCLLFILGLFSLIPIGLLLLSGLLYKGVLSDTIYRECEVKCKFVNKTCNSTLGPYDCSVTELIMFTTYKNKTYYNNWTNFTSYIKCLPTYRVNCEFPKTNPSKITLCTMAHCSDDNKYNRPLPRGSGASASRSPRSWSCRRSGTG